MSVDLGLKNEIKSLEDDGFYEDMCEAMKTDSVISSLRKIVAEEELEEITENGPRDEVNGSVYDRLLAELSLDTIFSDLRRRKNLSEAQSKFLSLVFNSVLNERDQYKRMLLEGRDED